MGKKLRILLMVLFLLPLDVWALTGSTTISCDKTTLSPGATATCTLNATVNGDTVSAVTAKINTSSNLELNTVTTPSIWQGNGEGGNIDLYTDSNKSGTFEIVTFTVKASSNVSSGADEKISITSIELFDSSFDSVAIADSNLNIRIASTVNTLSSFSLSSGTLSPTFNSTTLNYTATVDADNVTINATKASDKSKMSGNVGLAKLNYGANVFYINVTSEANSVRTYTLTITRPDNRSTDNKLSSLKLNEEEIKIVDGQTEYSYEVENDIMEANIEATLNDEKAAFIEGYGPQTVSLQEGENKIELKVKAENEKIATYTLTITRKKAEVINNNQSSDTGSTTTELTNPKTGSLSLYIIIGIVLVSIGVGFYFYKQCQKKQEKDNNEKES